MIQVYGIATIFHYCLTYCCRYSDNIIDIVTVIIGLLFRLQEVNESEIICRQMELIKQGAELSNAVPQLSNLIASKYVFFNFFEFFPIFF